MENSIKIMFFLLKASLSVCLYCARQAKSNLICYHPFPFYTFFSIPSYSTLFFSPSSLHPLFPLFARLNPTFILPSFLQPFLPHSFSPSLFFLLTFFLPASCASLFILPYSLLSVFLFQFLSLLLSTSLFPFFSTFFPLFPLSWHSN